MKVGMESNVDVGYWGGANWDGDCCGGRWVVELSIFLHSFIHPPINSLAHPKVHWNWNGRCPSPSLPPIFLPAIIKEENSNLIGPRAEGEKSEFIWLTIFPQK